MKYKFCLSSTVCFVLFILTVLVMQFPDSHNDSLPGLAEQEDANCFASACEILIPTVKGRLCYSELLRDLYSPLGYAPCEEKQRRLWLELGKQSNCSALFKKSRKPPVPQLAPRRVPDELVYNFTLNGYIAINYTYFAIMQSNVANRKPITKKTVDVLIQKITDRDDYIYPYDAQNLYKAVEQWSKSLQEKKVMVLDGASAIWLAAIAIKYGAKQVRILSDDIELTSDYPLINILHYADLVTQFRNYLASFDVAMSFSSLEHAGLGRYTEPLCPDCDLIEMQRVACLLRKEGLYFLGIPQSQDHFIYNSHRMYGLVRLPLLTANYRLLEIYANGWNMEEISNKYYRNIYYNYGQRKGVMVLSNMACNVCQKTQMLHRNSLTVSTSNLLR